jgi:hypothetical protein
VYPRLPLNSGGLSHALPAVEALDGAVGAIQSRTAD